MLRGGREEERKGGRDGRKRRREGRRKGKREGGEGRRKKEERESKRETENEREEALINNGKLILCKLPKHLFTSIRPSKIIISPTCIMNMYTCTYLSSPSVSMGRTGLNWFTGKVSNGRPSNID